MRHPEIATVRSRRLFQDMTSEKWVNLALAALALFYVIQIGLDVVWNNLCGHLGVDYCAFWSAGRIANTSNYSDMYDLGRLASLERSLFPAFGDPATFAVSPIAYLPVFMLPFQLLALLPPAGSYWLWTLINVGVLAAYLRFFMLKTADRPIDYRLLGMMLLSLPVFWNVLDGQVNVWLTICIGEFMRAMTANRPFRGGLWLGGLLLKPQNLLLIIVALLLQRSIRTLAGLAAASAALFATSWVLVGSAGMTRMVEVWLGFAEGIPTNYVELMMNWRMIGVHLAPLLGPLAGWITAGLGIAATALLALYLWRQPSLPPSPVFTAALLGTLAATGAVAWHSHIPTAMMLIPPLIILRQRDALGNNALLYWIFLPAAAYIVATLAAALMHLGGQAGSSIIATSPWLNFIRGGSMFGLNLYFLVWSVRRSAGPPRAAPGPA